MDPCTHYHDIASLQQPKLSQSVHREECTRCFDDQDTASGIDVCLICFNGGCLSDARHHAATHVARSGHAFTLNVRRRLKPSSQRIEDQEPPSKITKLAVVQEREEDKYDFLTSVKCWKCNPAIGRDVPQANQVGEIKSLVQSVMQSMSSARQSEVQSWEEEITPCEHSLTLEQLATGHISAEGLAHCSQCELKSNLWLCLTCGSLGCGRAQFGGVGGNGHGLNHFESTGHPVSVKLGTITAEGGADIYCYACNDARQDPDLKAHLSTFGINIAAQTKTEKSMTELQIEHNLNYEFSLVGEDGKALQPLFGPRLTGLRNLGNSCYMASVIQTLFSMPIFQIRYAFPDQHWNECNVPLPADCLECQMLKLSDGLLSGRYSIASNESGAAGPDPVFQAGLKPAGFKALVGKGHAEFATMRQQDAEEFFTHLINTLRRFQRAQNSKYIEPTESFSFGLEQRLQCTVCKGVRYRVDVMDSISVPVRASQKGEKDGRPMWDDVTLEECLDTVSSEEVLEYQCPQCQKNVTATKRSGFSTFPDILVVHAKKFQLVNWVPQKLDIPLLVPGTSLSLDKYLSSGLQSDEVELPQDPASAPAAAQPQFNEAALEQLQVMGFPIVRCQKALLATGNSDPEAAMNWLFAHMEDPDIDDPIVVQASGSTSSTEQYQSLTPMLIDMGFTEKQALKALKETNGDAERAVDWLFNHPDDQGDEPAEVAEPPTASKGPPGSPTLPATYRLKAFISHKGPSVHSGHYVAHIRMQDPNLPTQSQWVLFNDEKVVKADEESVVELQKLAYLYIFERQ